MMENTSFLADSWVSICGALGALVVLMRLNRLTSSHELTVRFRACLIAIIILLTFRVGHWAEWGWGYAAITYSSAALLPLFALLLAEGMMRLHAPKVMKYYCGCGAFVFVLFALLPTVWLGTLHTWALLLFQLSGLGGVVYMVMRRDYGGLSGGENQALNRVMLSFLLILPLLATDFLSPFVAAIPARLGGVAVLGLCLLTISINRPSLSHWRIVGSMTVLCGVVVLSTIITARLAGTNLLTSFQIGAVALATTMLLATWQAMRTLMTEDGYLLILRAISQSSKSGPDAAAQLIKTGAGISDALMLGEDDLGDFDSAVLRRLFTDEPVRVCSEVPENEQLSWLFTKFEATHAICITITPMCLIVCNNPGLMAYDSRGYGLTVLQRMAAYTAREDTSC